MRTMKYLSLKMSFALIASVILFSSCKKEENEKPNNGSSVTDVDGKTYNTVKIGKQTWMAENLKATKYADGTAIPLVTDDTAWAALGNNDTDKAYCYYNNDAGLGYGALYTYAAATNGDNSGTNVQGVCPTDWHLPSDAEWIELENYLADNGYNFDGSTGGGRDKIGKAMASETGWNSSNNIGTIGNTPSTNNASGFSALAGGYRIYTNGAFPTAGIHGYWWSSTQLDSYAYNCILLNNSSNVNRILNYKSNGFSVRCVRD